MRVWERTRDKHKAPIRISDGNAQEGGEVPQAIELASSCRNSRLPRAGLETGESELARISELRSDGPAEAGPQAESPPHNSSLKFYSTGVANGQTPAPSYARMDRLPIGPQIANLPH